MIDLAVAGMPFLDMTFLGLDRVPQPGEELYARELMRSPGGGAITAVGAARLGLATALVSPLSADADGERLRAALEADGVQLVPPHAGLTATTVVVPAAGDRAMITYAGAERARPDEVAALDPRAIICGLEDVDIAPPGAALYISCGDDEARRFAGRPPAVLGRAHTLLVNESEARLLTGAERAEDAADRLAAQGCPVVVTLGPRGALGVLDGRRVAVPGVDNGPPVDTTGAGDLFAAAYVWAEQAGAEPEERLRWAVLYATLSVSVPTAVAGAVTRAELIEQGARRGLTGPRAVASVASPKEE